MNKKLFLLLIFLSPLVVSSNPMDLDLYIAEGLKNNLALQQQEFSLDKSLEALREAKGMFLPTVSIQARYSRAGGGRMIYFPVGDLMNPVHGSLNDLFLFHGIIADYPTDIPNEQIPFLREKEQETKIRVVQPIYQRSISHNIKLKSALNQIDSTRLNIFKRQLVFDIKSAYYNYAKTLRVIELLNQTRSLLEENKRISENLVKNGKATEDVIFRAEAELADLDTKKAEAEKNKALAAAYFNFLINRDLEEIIRINEIQKPSPSEEIEIKKAVRRALEFRHEFQQLNYALEATDSQIGLVKSGSLPSLLAVLDYGIQGEKYSFEKDDDYWMASLVLEWTLFNGNQNKAKKAQAILERKKLEVQKLELEKQIEIQVYDTYQTMRSAELAIDAAQKREESAQKSFTIVSKKYENGMAPQILLLDAQNTLFSASINHILTFYDFLIQKARFEWATASIDLAKYQQD